jgi:putative transposase
MRRKRRALPAEFKAKVALAALRGDLTLNEVAAKYEVHANQVSIWKKQLLEAAKEFFSDRREHRKKDDEELVARLYQEIGRLKMELDWLKKKVGDFE